MYVLLHLYIMTEELPQTGAEKESTPPSKVVVNVEEMIRRHLERISQGGLPPGGWGEGRVRGKSGQGFGT